MQKKIKDLEFVRFFDQWLRNNFVPGYHGACWGYNFDWPNRSFFAPVGTPTIVNTAFIGLAYSDLFIINNVASSMFTKDPLRMARSACDFIMKDLNRDRPASNERCFSYTPFDHRFVHNANVLGAWLLAEVGAQTGENELKEMAWEAALYTVRRQRSDGSWTYGESHQDGWIDNFHTGYVLVSLQRIQAALGIDTFTPSVVRGYEYWKGNFFRNDGAPKYYAHKIYPIDIHCVAQAILTFLAFMSEDPEALALATRTAHWGIENMQDRKGFFHYQIYPNLRIRTPFMRWGQAWMQRSLTEMVFRQEYVGRQIS
jgi:hypothetical protein